MAAELLINAACFSSFSYLTFIASVDWCYLPDIQGLLVSNILGNAFETRGRFPSPGAGSWPIQDLCMPPIFWSQDLLWGNCHILLMIQLADFHLSFFRRRIWGDRCLMVYLLKICLGSRSLLFFSCSGNILAYEHLPSVCTGGSEFAPGTAQPENAPPSSIMFSEYLI